MTCRRLFGLLLAAAALVISIARAPAEEPPIRIGLYASLTGKEGTWGQSYQNGALLARDEINAAGGVLGRKVELIIEDDQSKAGEAATSVSKLISRDKVVGILGEVSSGRSIEAAPVCQRSKVPMISAGSNPKVTEMGDYIFRVAFIDPFQGTVMAAFAKNKFHASRVALMTDAGNAYSVGLAKYFKERFVADGGSIVIEQRFNGGEKDFRAQLTAIKNSNADLIFVPTYYTEAGLIVAQARQLGITIPLTGGDGWSAPEFVEIAGKAAENTYFCDAFSTEFDAPVTQRFIKAFNARYHEDPDSVAPHGYDGTMLMVDAIRRANSTEGPKIREALATTKNFPGVSGATTVDAQRNVTKPAFIMTVKDGKFKFVEAVLP